MSELLPERSWLRPARLALTLAFLLGFATSLLAHIGSPTVFFEGQAGAYPVRVVVRPPEVIPGLAQVSIRVLTNGVEHVTALPIRWNTGLKGAPPPDEAVSVRGETNLFSTQLWFMQGGAQSVAVQISGTSGSGRVIVPVNAVATRVLGMPSGLGRALFGLGMVLLLLMASIIGAAVRESVLPAGQAPNKRRVWLARAATVIAALVLGLLVWGGGRWWGHEASNYRNTRLYQPLEMSAILTTNQNRTALRLGFAVERFKRGAPLVPDHGKLMHLFMVREPGLDLFAHLHPEKVDWKTFEIILPSLPAGQYRLYADITYETGLSDTLTAALSLKEPLQVTSPVNPDLIDPDDAWCQSPPLQRATSTPSPTRDVVQTKAGPLTVDWVNRHPLVENQETTLQFEVHDASGSLAQIQPYLGMTGHLVLRRDDGAVFTHLHPGGSFSMAAQRLFEMRTEGTAPLKAAAATDDPICQLPTSEELEAAWRMGKVRPDRISFPYAFPKPGHYRLWLQFKSAGQICTSVFDTEVEALSR